MKHTQSEQASKQVSDAAFGIACGTSRKHHTLGFAPPGCPDSRTLAFGGTTTNPTETSRHAFLFAQSLVETHKHTRTRIRRCRRDRPGTVQHSRQRVCERDN